MSSTPKILTFEELQIEVGGATRHVLVARPAAELRLGSKRLERMRGGDFSSKLDRDIVGALTERSKEYAVVIFHAQDSEGAPVWGFDADLDDEQRMEFGQRLLSSQIALYRQLVEQNVGGLIGVGFGSFELAAFQRGTIRVVTKLAEELESAEGPRATELEIELWLIEHAAKWTGLSLAEYSEKRLPAEIGACDEMRAEIQALLARARG